MGYRVEEVSLAGGPALAIRGAVPMTELPRFFAGAFTELAAAAYAARAKCVAPPFARYLCVWPERVEVEAVMPLDVPVGTCGRAKPQILAKGPAIQVAHQGPYDAMAPAYSAIQQWIEGHHVQAAEPPREVYLTSPGEVPDPGQWQTLIVQPLAS